MIGENMKKIILVTMACLLVFFNINASAEKTQKPEILGEAEISAHLIRMSEDGTGIIKFRQCGDCEIVLVTITAATRFYLNGDSISASQARKVPKHGFVGMQYALDSKEVRTIGYTK